MQRNDEHRDDELIDLGAVTEETKGRLVGINDFEGGLQASLGLADD